MSSQRNSSLDFALPVLCGGLFLSGAGSLIFETLWFQVTGLTVGNSVWAVAVVLSSFMGGLALGNALATTWRVRRLRPLHLYASCEVAVAVWGLAIVFLLPEISVWMRPIFQTLWTHSATLALLRILLSMFVLIVPATAMGLTLPILMEDPVLDRSEFTRAISLVYGFNTLGAVAGALAGEIFLVQRFGLAGTAIVAGVANSVAALIAMSVAKVRREGAAVRAAERPRRFDVAGLRAWRLLVVTFGAGAVLLCLEVVWFRFLRLYLASYTLVFAIMLAAILVAIALGSIGASVIGRRWRATPLLPILLLLAAIATLVCYIFFPGPAISARLGSFNSDSWPVIAAMSLALMFPTAFLSGILFPTIVTRVQQSVGDSMNATGLTTFCNTVGAAVGPLLASFLLLPAVGYQASLLTCAVAYGLLAVVASEKRNWSVKHLPGIGMISLSLALVAVIAFFPYHRDELHFAHAAVLYESGYPERLVKRVEGTSDTYQLRRADLFGQPYYYRLLTNAMSMSGTTPHSQRYMRLFAYLALAFRPEAKDVLLICYGCGNTADAFVRNRQLKRIDIVDISKEVLGLAGYYTGLSYSNPLRDPRVTSFVQDGRFFLQSSPRRYDVITGEPPPPKAAGAVNLYTQEFFSLMRSRLKEGGIATFWLPLNQVTVVEIKAILRAFRNAFPVSAAWTSSDDQWILMGINGPGEHVTEGELRRLWNDSSTGADLKRIGIEVPQQLGALFLMDGEEMARVSADTPPLVDEYPKRLSAARPDEKASTEFASPYMQESSAFARFQSSPLIQRIWPGTLNTSLRSYFIVREARYISSAIGSNKMAELDLYLRHSRLRTPVLEVLLSDELRVALAQAVAKDKEHPPRECLPDLVAAALAQRDFNKAIQLLETEREVGAFAANELHLLTYVYCLNGEVQKAEQLVASNAVMIRKDWFVDWLWAKLKTDFGFQPPS